MIIEEAVKDVEVVGEHNSKKATISDNKLAKLQYLLTKGLYKDPITAVIAEWANNGIDSVVQAGKSPIDTPVMVCINKTDKGQFVFSVQDKGAGLDDRDFEDVCMNYLESTKEGDNDTIGHFGIGMKSFLSLERSATFTCRKEGIERKYLVYEGAEFVNFNLIHQKPTTEENGVLAELVIKDWAERLLFIDKAKAKLAYYDTVVLVVDGIAIHNDIHRNELFQWSSLNRNSEVHLALKDVYYSIDYESLGISPIPLPIAIRLGLGDGLTPTPSRESYITNDKVRKLLISKIEKIADWFIKKYNETVLEFPNLLDAYPYLGNSSYQVTVNTQVFSINSLSQYSKIKILQPKVKGLVKRDGDWYKSKKDSLLDEYLLVGYILQTGKMVNKKINMTNSVMSKTPTVLVANDFVGNVREYLKSKYGKSHLFVRDGNKIKLGGKADNRKWRDNGFVGLPDSYYNNAELATKSKDKWRDLIKEWDFVVSGITTTFKDERKIASSKEYADWLDKKQQLQKMRKASGYISSTYTGLNKQQGDVTMAYSYARYGRIHFKKDVYPISGLTKNQYLTVIISLEDAEKAKAYAEISASPFVKFAVVGKLETKKIPNHYQFITFKEYLMSSKPFTRLASAILFKRTIDEFTKLANNKSDVFKLCAKSLMKDVNTLDAYQKKYLLTSRKEIETAILGAAEEKKMFDLQYWDVYKRVREGLNKYDFINLFRDPEHLDMETKRRYDKVITQVLLFRKKKYDDLDGAEIVFKNK